MNNELENFDNNNNNNNNNQIEEDSGRTALKIIFILAFFLSSIDLMEIYYSYLSLSEYSNTLLPEVFDNCVKYHIISQIFYTLFAALAGISACLMSIGLLINYQIFALKLLDSFLYYNFYCFGPLLLGSSILAFIYFPNIIYTCDTDDYTKQYLNISTVISVFIGFLISLLITFGYTGINSFEYFNNSIRFNNEGNYFLGKLFWKYVFNRATTEINRNFNNENEVRQEELNEALNNSLEN